MGRHATITITPDTVEWVEPPSRKAGGPGNIAAFIEVLKQRPGTWARYPISVGTSAATYLKSKGCEATSRTNAEGNIDIYARWPR